jgi:fluoroquinolone resistance protein
MFHQTGLDGFKHKQNIGRKMDASINLDKTFENEDFSGKKLTSNEYDNCEFVNCNFTGSILNNADFMDCTFKNCNFSLAVVEEARIKNIKFIGCKLMGLDFSKCNDFLFSASFENCHMDYCSFYKKKMKKTSFVDCSLKDVDFAEVDLSGSIFKNCDLLNASFMQTILEKADLRTAINYSLDPELNKIKKARFSQFGIAGLLVKYNIDIE